MYYQLLIGAILSITAFSLFVAIPVYLVILIVIKRNKNIEPLNSEFFVIFFALGVVDLICYTLFLTKKIFFFGYVPSFFLPYNQTNAYASFYYYPFWVFGYLQYQLVFLLTLNRFVSIVFPVFYSRYWTVNRTHLIIFCCFLLSLILCSPILDANCQITQYTSILDGKERVFQFGPVTSDKLTARYFSTVWSLHVYGLLVSSVILYSIMLIELKKNTLIKNKKKVEVQMAYIGFVVFMLNALFTVYFFLRDYILADFSDNSHLHEWLLYFLSDIYDLPNGLMLWFTSSKIRKIVKEAMHQITRFGKVDVNVIINSGQKGSGAPNRPPTLSGGHVQKQTATLVPVERVT